MTNIVDSETFFRMRFERMDDMSLMTQMAQFIGSVATFSTEHITALSDELDKRGITDVSELLTVGLLGTEDELL